MYFDFEYYKDKKVVIHCKSKTQAKKWCRLMHKNGFKWSTQSLYYLKVFYHDYKENTCYTLNGSFGPIWHFKNNGYTIIEFEDIIAGKYDRRKKMFTKKDLRNGDYVQHRNGENYVYIERDGKGYLVNDKGFNSIDSFKDNLTLNRYCSDWDIMKVIRTSPCGINHAFKSYHEKDIVYKRSEQKLWNGMTYEEAHRALWNALADGEVTTKREWFELHKGEEPTPKDKCFACAVAASNSGDKYNRCQHCPLCEYKSNHNCLDGLYNEWQRAKGFEKFKLAHEIANLPWKEK